MDLKPLIRASLTATVCKSGTQEPRHPSILPSRSKPQILEQKSFLQQSKSHLQQTDTTFSIMDHSLVAKLHPISSIKEEPRSSLAPRLITVDTSVRTLKEPKLSNSSMTHYSDSSNRKRYSHLLTTERSHRSAWIKSSQQKALEAAIGNKSTRCVYQITTILLSQPKEQPLRNRATAWHEIKSKWIIKMRALRPSKTGQTLAKLFQVASQTSMYTSIFRIWTKLRSCHQTKPELTVLTSCEWWNTFLYRADISVNILIKAIMTWMIKYHFDYAET